MENAILFILLHQKQHTNTGSNYFYTVNKKFALADKVEVFIVLLCLLMLYKSTK